MTLVVCVDDRMGMQFNGRRQSQDRLLRRRLLDLVPTRLVMSVRSGAMFSREDDVIAREDYLSLPKPMTGSLPRIWTICPAGENLTG